jgi:LCP family protein required for cell wall assembly
MQAATPPKPAEEAMPDVALAARQIPIDMSLPGDSSPSRLQTLLGFARQKKHRYILKRALATTSALAVMFGAFFMVQGYLKLHDVFRGGTVNAAALQPHVNPDLLKGEGSGRVNILLLGRGGGNHDGPDLTDSMMVASVDPLNHKVTLLSLPRDLWVSVPGAGDMKINAAWETGVYKYLGKISPNSTNPQAISAGFKTADEVVGQVLGINIDYNALVDFQAFQQAVDTVGGININVPSDLVDPTMAWENHNNPTLAKAGQQTMSGAQALLYVRSRETSSDFARAQRQRDVLTALEGKVATLGTLSDPLKLTGLLNAFGNNVQTDLSLTNMTRLYGILKDVNGPSILSLDLSSGQYVSTGNLAGQSIVLPKSGLFNYTDIQNYVRTQLKDPYIVKENAKILILNGTNTPGLATAMDTQLTPYGYNIIGTANTPQGGWQQTQLINVTQMNSYTQHFLQERLATVALNKLPSGISGSGADFVIIIGNDQIPASPSGH